MTPRQTCLAIVAGVGADLLDSSRPGGLDLNMWTPPGVVWQATGGHSLSINYHTNRAAGWRDLLRDLRLGVAACTLEDCETCE